jgi:hypothetical protein
MVPVRALFPLQGDRHGTPVSLAAHAAFFQGNYEGGEEGWYSLAGAQLYKKFPLADTLALYPYVGFSLALESSSFGGGDRERSLYLTRQIGVHAQLALSTDSWLRVTAEEQGLRRETYRAARVAYVRRF